MAARKPPLEIEVDCPHCGGCFGWLPHGEQKPRSPEQLKRFMLMCKLAYQAWPDWHGTQFNNAQECRYWLTMKCGQEYRDVKNRISLLGMNRQQAMFIARAVIAGTGAYQIASLEGSDIVFYEAKSVAVMQMGHRKFNYLNTLMAETILAEAKLSVDTLIAEWAALKEGRITVKERAPIYREKAAF